ncbi:histidine ammonia-lyase [Janibacter melonis]|uniref:histidine ammonia-lyase n=1 Tax=Janibacter melonis TaxID=262209 RepID=UPI00177EE85B|nr:histidine ammonia-lyase [Janibacter melonis]
MPHLADLDAPHTTVRLGDRPLTVEEVVAVARRGARVEISDAAWERVRASRTVVEDLAEDTVAHYGVSTGFGALATTHIPHEKRTQLQRSLVRSHAAGMGDPVEEEVVRALMLLRVQTLATGRTGIREETLRLYLALLDHGITPLVREYGSLGCSGDLAPLAHCAMVLIGEGEVLVDGAPQPAAEALAAAGLHPVVLHEKEGLALINGTDGMLGMLCLAIHDLHVQLTTADIACAMSVEGLLGTDDVFAEDLQALRPHPGQAQSAANLRAVLAGSPIRESHRDPHACTRVQDAYSLRCAPSVHGAARDTLAHARRVADAELASAVDNPVITLDGRVESNGNFHGAPVAYVLDFLAIVAADVASMSERRTDRFLDVSRSHGLPPFLADDPGTDSGLMIAQYTAAGMVSEMKRLAAPASVDSIPSSAMQEDHVSMGWAGARKLRRSVDALTRVLTVELVTAARGIALRAPLQPAAATAAVIAELDSLASTAPGPDRDLGRDLMACATTVRDGGPVLAAESVTGPLH